MHELEQELECSRKTVIRAIDHLRDDLQAPLDYDEEKKGWWYTQEGDRFQLPGLWMTARELQSLVLLLDLLEHFDQGLLGSELKIIEQQIHKLLMARNIDPQALSQQFNVLPHAHKPIVSKTFKVVGEALVHHQQLSLSYLDFNNRKSQRMISPQTLVYYRDNWYLDAWCHLRKELRTFVLSRMLKVSPGKAGAKRISRAERLTHFASSYGIFAGKAKHTARLRFLPRIAREIAQQQWHPEQIGQWEGEEYVLEIPYDKDQELIGDILRHMPDVIVESPASLKRSVVLRLRAGLGANG